MSIELFIPAISLIALAFFIYILLRIYHMDKRINALESNNLFLRKILLNHLSKHHTDDNDSDEEEEEE